MALNDAGSPARIAEDTLYAATRFLRREATRAWLADPWRPEQHIHVRARLFGNWLNELDRLLHVFLDAASLAGGAAAQPRQRNTAAKLQRVAAPHRDSAVERRRLDAMARARLAFTFTAGLATRADERGGTHMTVGWYDDGLDALRRYRLGQRILLTGPELLGICDFYDALARQVSRQPLPRERRYSASNRAASCSMIVPPSCSASMIVTARL